MTDVLHLQTRVYPQDHGGLDLAEPEHVLPSGARVRLGALGSLAYREQRILELDGFPDGSTPEVPAGVEVVWRRVRVLATGGLLVSTALRHDRDLTTLDVYELADIDAAIDRQLRPSEAEAVRALYVELVEAGLLLVDSSPEDDPATSEGAATGFGDPVRFNCHLVASEPAWEPSHRVTANGELGGTRCRMLLAYTFAWELDPAAGPDVLLTEFEGADLALAQRVLLAAAMARGVDVLDLVSGGTCDVATLRDFRGELDRTRATYHRLDAYRYDSSQRARATYLAARREMDLDAVHERAEQLLSQVSESLTAAVSDRAISFDRRLNRFVGALGIVTFGLFVLDLIVFVRAGVPLPLGPRLTTAAALVLLGATALGVLVWRGRRAGA